MTIKIEKDVPIPGQIRTGRWQHLLKRMSIGDCFKVTPSDLGTARSMHSCKGSIAQAAHRLGMKLTFRELTRTHGEAFGVWFIGEKTNEK